MRNRIYEKMPIKNFYRTKNDRGQKGSRILANMGSKDTTKKMMM